MAAMVGATLFDIDTRFGSIELNPFLMAVGRIHALAQIESLNGMRNEIANGVFFAGANLLIRDEEHGPDIPLKDASPQ